MIQAFVRLTLCAVLSLGNIGSMRQLTNSDPPSISIEAKGAGQVHLEQDQHEWTCTHQRLIIPLPGQDPVRILAKADENARIERLWIDEQEIEAAKDQESYEITRSFDRNTPIVVSFSNWKTEDFDDSQTESFEPAQDSSFERMDDTKQEPLSQTEENKSNAASIGQILMHLGSTISSLSSDFSKLDDVSQFALSQLPNDSFSEKPLVSGDLDPGLEGNFETADSSSQAEWGGSTETESQSSLSESIRTADSNSTLEAQEESLDSSSQSGETASQRVTWKDLSQSAVEEFYHQWQTDFVILYESYLQGNSDEFKDFRQALGAKCEITSFLDENGFLPTDVFDDPDAIPGWLQAFNPGLVQKAAPQTRARAKVRAAAPNSGGITGEATISSRNLYGSVPTFGGYTVSNYLWTLSNGCNAFCANALGSEPLPNEKASNIREVSDSNLRKAIYYGYGGPANLFKAYTTAQQVIFTNEMVSHAQSGKSISEITFNGTIWSSGMKDRWNEVVSQPDPPARYKVYLADFPGSGPNFQGNNSGRQPLAFGFMGEEDKGALQIVKSIKSENGLLPNYGGSNYSLQGAVYEYGQGSTAAGTLTIGADGCSQTVVVKPGTYWVKEITAPKGFALDRTSYSITVTAGSSTAAPNRIIVYDPAQYCQADVLVVKTDKRTNQPVAGAKFMVKYYALDPAKATLANIKKATAVQEWELTTNSEGKIIASNTKFPIGVLTIEEIEAPDGYRLDDTVHIMALDPKNSKEECFMTLSPIRITNEPIVDLNLYKVDGSSGTRLPGAQFTVTSPSNRRFTLTTDTNGSSRFTLDEDGQWTVRETKAPAGYTIYSKAIPFKVNGSTVTCLADSETVKFDGTNLELVVSNFTEGFSLQVHKVDGNDQPLQGAVFGLYGDSGLKEKLDEGISDEQGRIDFGPLKTDKEYYLAEISPPEGYKPLVKKSGAPKTYRFEGFYDNGLYAFRAGSGASAVTQLTEPPVSDFKNTEYAFWSPTSNSGSILHIKLRNDKQVILPKTGAWQVPLALSMGSTMIVTSLVRPKHRSKRSAHSFKTF